MSYVKPVTPSQFPNSLTLQQFLQTVLTGVSGLQGEFVRPKWQAQPPKSPDIDKNWLAFGITSSTPNANGYLGVRPDGSSISSRHERLEIQISMYGPNSLEVAGLIRDGFQIPQNRDALRAASMGFTETGSANRAPDFINERWVERVEMTLVLQREVIRNYPISTFVAANGIVHTVIGNEEYLMNFETETP